MFSLVSLFPFLFQLGVDILAGSYKRIALGKKIAQMIEALFIALVTNSKL